MKNFVQEFKEFAMRGNVMDLAVAVVVGAAFGKIVTSLTNDVIMPVIGVLTGTIDFSDLALTLKAAHGDVAAVTLNYGLLINAVVSFVIVSFAIFVVVKMMNKLKKQEEKEPKKDVKPSKEELLLTEIRDLLKKG
jgi:large conductance mechanosensitive channel